MRCEQKPMSNSDANCHFHICHLTESDIQLDSLNGGLTGPLASRSLLLMEVKIVQTVKLLAHGEKKLQRQRQGEEDGQRNY